MSSKGTGMSFPHKVINNSEAKRMIIFDAGPTWNFQYPVEYNELSEYDENEHLKLGHSTK